MIVGITGTFASGKDAAAEYLEQKGYEHISSADMLRQELKKKGLPENRDNLRITANELVKKYGGEYLAEKAYKSALNRDKLIISAVRRQGEIDFLKSKDRFVLIFIDAPVEVRYQRMKNRSREGKELVTLEDLKQKEKKEFSGDNSQRLDYCKRHADYLLDNSSNLRDLQIKIDKILLEID